MLPAPQTLLHARSPFPAPRPAPRPARLQRCWRVGAAAIALAASGGCGAAFAQDAPPAIPAPAPLVEASDSIAFEADRVEYGDKDETVTASGNVFLRRGEQTLRANRVTYNTKSGEIVAAGNIRMVDEDGNQLYTDEVTLDREFTAGAMKDMLLALREGGRLAADSGARDANGTVVLSRAAYSACAVEDDKGCPKPASWRVTADRVIYDANAKTVNFKGARLELFGAPLLPLPGLRIMSDGRSSTGMLVPRIGFSPSNGVEFGQSYYLKLDNNRDITATINAYTKALPMAEVQYRALGDRGAYQITGYATQSKRESVSGTGTTSASHEFRGYLAANGRFQFDRHWSLAFSARLASDRTFLRRYDISRDDRLRSMVNLERIDSQSYFSLSGWATQTMRIGASQGQVPVALPVFDYRYRFANPILGGKVELQANSLAITRTSGQDTQRAFASARWDLRRLTGMGQELTLTGLVRGDVYHSNENTLTATASYRGNRGWQARGVALAAAEIKWPFAGSLMGGTQVLSPRFQIVASPKVRNLSVPNEDARAIDLEDSNLFALNRFPGYDRIEDGVRFTYGADWQFEMPRWRFRSTIGQSYRLTRKPTLLPDGTGLAGRLSDIVGRNELRYRNFIKLTHRYRLDKDSLRFRRNEFDATVGSERTYAEVGYIKLDRNATAGLEDITDREELRVAGRIAFARYFSMFGSGVFNLTDRKEDPLQTSDGFEPLRTRLGIAYQDDCLEMALTWRRDFFRTGDARKGNSFLVTFALRNLGIR